MHSHQIDLRPGESLRLGKYIVTLVETENGEAVFEIDNPGGQMLVESLKGDIVDAATADELAVLA